MEHLTTTRPAQALAPAPVRREAEVVAAAATAALLTWLLAHAADIDLTVRSGPGTRNIGLLGAVVTAVLVSTVAAGLLRLLERRATHGLRAWTIVAAVTWGLSFAGPLSATSASAGAVLAAMHLLVGAVVLVGLRRSRVA